MEFLIKHHFPWQFLLSSALSTFMQALDIWTKEVILLWVPKVNSMFLKRSFVLNIRIICLLTKARTSAISLMYLAAFSLISWLWNEEVEIIVTFIKSFHPILSKFQNDALKNKFQLLMCKTIFFIQSGSCTVHKHMPLLWSWSNEGNDYQIQNYTSAEFFSALSMPFWMEPQLRPVTMHAKSP